MKHFFYSRLAMDNIRKNARNYIPYIITCTLTIIMFYSFISLSMNDGLTQMKVGRRLIPYILNLGIWVVGIFAVIFLFYTYSFLIKRRQKEFGLFNILGMEKKHISKIVALETLYVAVISLVAGLAIGILLNKLLYMLLLRMIDAELTLDFSISFQPIITTVLFFGGIFFVIFLYSIGRIHLSNPIELLHSTKTGEKEPKTKIIMTILGVLCLGGGYYISLTTEQIQYAITNFFLAVILVVVGTYLLFTVGSVTLLKLLKKNKKYYYKTNHFISVSSMIYRMKRNAVGLANICILSTMVLVMLSVTTTLMIGLEDTLNKSYSHDIILSVYVGSDNNKEQITSSVEKIINETAKEHQLSISNISKSYFVAFGVCYNNGKFSIDNQTDYTSNLNDIHHIDVISVSDYNRILNKKAVLKSNEILLFSEDDAVCNNKEIVFLDQNYKVMESSNILPNSLNFDYAIMSINTIIIVSDESFEQLAHLNPEDYYSNNSMYGYAFDLSGTNTQKISFTDDLNNKIFSDDNAFLREYGLLLSSKPEMRTSLYEVYGGLLFVGIFLGILFTAAMVLIIYYKQTSEGYEDRERFEIMQKVGLDYHD
ncbi:MAG: FtsX-like permease family protein, partial [Acutalibacteraceae bacterium]